MSSYLRYITLLHGGAGAGASGGDHAECYKQVIENPAQTRHYKVHLNNPILDLMLVSCG